MDHIEMLIGAIIGAFTLAAVGSVIWVRRTLILIRDQVKENARGISVGIENQQSIAEGMMVVVREFKEATSYQYRVMDEFLDAYFRSQDDGEQSDEQQK
jgi:Tfp pilus assembly protein PilW